MFVSLFEILFLTYILLSAIQPSSSYPVIDLQFDISGALSRAQAFLSSKNTRQNSQSSSSNTFSSADFEFDISGVYSRALLTTVTSTRDYSTSRPIKRSKIASNLYFDEKVPMYSRVPTEIVYRQGSPTEIRYKSRLPNTWTIYSQQDTGTSSQSSIDVPRKKREATSSLPDRATWTEIVFRQGSPTEIRYHTRRKPTWATFRQHDNSTTKNTVQKKRQIKAVDLEGEVTWTVYSHHGTGAVAKHEV